VRTCAAPFNLISSTSVPAFADTKSGNTICGSAFFAPQNFQNAQEICFALGGHIPTYSEIYILAKAHGVANPNVMLAGDWIGNRVGDDEALAVTAQPVLTNFEMAANKNDIRAFRCVQTSTIVQ
jgi:hypothetical protein